MQEDFPRQVLDPNDILKKKLQIFFMNKQITNALFTSAKDGNLGAMIFFLKNRAGWKDKIETEHTGDGLKIDVKAPDNFRQILEELDKLAEHKSKKDDRVLQ